MASYPIFSSEADLQHVYDNDDTFFDPLLTDYNEFWDQGFGINPDNDGFPFKLETTTPSNNSFEQPLPVRDNVPQETNDQETEMVVNGIFTGLDTSVVQQTQEQVVQPEPPRCFHGYEWYEMCYAQLVSQTPQYVNQTPQYVSQAPQYDQYVQAPHYDQGQMQEAVYLQPKREPVTQYEQVPQYDPVPQYDQGNMRDVFHKVTMRDVIHHAPPVPQYDQGNVAVYLQPKRETVSQYDQVHMRDVGNVLAVEPHSETDERVKKEKRKMEDEPEEFEIYSEGCADRVDGEDDPTGGFKLPASKSPIMEAMVVCALNGWGIDIVRNSRGNTGEVEVTFQVNDFDRYYRISRLICSKQRPTDDVGSRVKSLRRWFVNFPKKKDRNDNVPFLLDVKPNIAKKVSEIIERNTRVLGLTKRRRRQ